MTIAAHSVRDLLEAGVHFGHQTKRWNPKMKPFIFGSRAGIYIIDLEQTASHLERACAFVDSVAARGEQVLFIGTKKQAKAIVQESATRCNMPYVINRWMGGTLTNFQTIKRSLELMHTLRKQREEGYFERLTKKDATHLSRQLAKLEESFSGIAAMERPPACLFVIDPKREQNAVHEANRLNIPVVAICDTNADPDKITYPVPGNDDAIRSIRLLTDTMADTILAGRRAAGLPERLAPSAGEEPAEESVVAPPAVRDMSSPARIVPARAAAPTNAEAK
jgi:small subunit ribosomal protein S2